MNTEEKIDKFVDRRTGKPDGLKAGMQLQTTAAQASQGIRASMDAQGCLSFQNPRGSGRMDEQDARSERPDENLISRPPTQADYLLSSSLIFP